VRNTCACASECLAYTHASAGLQMRFAPSSRNISLTCLRFVVLPSEISEGMAGNGERCATESECAEDRAPQEPQELIKSNKDKGDLPAHAHVHTVRGYVKELTWLLNFKY
jgi:hypothetical protein